nr:hypothetical protein [Tanacetum cinerariifolium]
WQFSCHQSATSDHHLCRRKTFSAGFFRRTQKDSPSTDLSDPLCHSPSRAAPTTYNTTTTPPPPQSHHHTAAATATATIILSSSPPPPTTAGSSPPLSTHHPMHHNTTFIPITAAAAPSRCHHPAQGCVWLFDSAPRVSLFDVFSAKGALVGRETAQGVRLDGTFGLVGTPKGCCFSLGSWFLIDFVAFVWVNSSVRMPPKRSSTSEASTMSQAAIRKLVADCVAAALETQTATMAEADNPIRNTRPRKFL